MKANSVTESPYNLRAEGNSDEFYRKAEQAADLCQQKLKPMCKALLQKFTSHIVSDNIEALRTEDEYFIELIIAGIFIKRYLQSAIHSSPFVLLCLSMLARLRSISALKPVIDSIRGYLLSPPKNMRTVSEQNALSLSQFKSLLRYLNASGDFSLESDRLNNWYRFLIKNRHLLPEFYSICTRLVTQFEKETSVIFSNYTSPVDEFINKKATFYHNREDCIFCTRPPIEYHLNIVCAEILNRSFRKDFDTTTKKIVLLPTCMRNNRNVCKATSGADKKCQKCSNDCTIGQVTRLCEKYDVETRLIPHSSDFSDTLKLWQNKPATGLVGIACILNLLKGGYEMRKLAIPSQCVFLDWAGCKHWTQNGIPTNININRLFSILGLEKSE